MNDRQPLVWVCSEVCDMSPSDAPVTARIAFFGTPEVAVGSLEALVAADDLEVVLVVTNPDRPKGRSGTPVPSPVKARATALGIDVLQPERPIEIAQELRERELDAVAIVAYGAILPMAVLDAGGRGFVNLHFSLLPRWRGAAPVQAAVRAGDPETGVTCFVLDEGMDTGPVLRTAVTPLGPQETSGDLFARLTRLGAPTLLDAVRALVAGEVPKAQDPTGGTVAGKIRPEDVALDLTGTAQDLTRLIHSANPAPGAHTTFRGRRFKIWRARAIASTGEHLPGQFEPRHADGAVVTTGEGAMVLLEVQPEGKSRMTGDAFANGYQPTADDRLGA
ncbi:MAG: methionyl-tRNA formyltransferase [Glaciecola sp.]|jgi:methionyl-tRNA formyltransferase